MSRVKDKILDARTNSFQHKSQQYIRTLHRPYLGQILELVCYLLAFVDSFDILWNRRDCLEWMGYIWTILKCM